MESDVERGGNWFEPRVSYEGEIRLEVQDPHGYLIGPGRFKVDERGAPALEMEVEDCESDDIDTSDDLAQHALLYGERLTDIAGGGIQLGVTGSPTECGRLSLETDEGCFTTDDTLLVLGNLQLNGHARYVRDRSGEARYLVCPLINFTADYQGIPRRYRNHPLRLLRPSKPNTIVASPPLLPVTVKGCKSFIQPLLDRKERLKQLREREALSHITDLWIIEVPEEGKADPFGWFPDPLLDLLSFTVGTRVDAAWMELRDSSGQLCERVHWYQTPPIFREGHEVFDSTCAGGWTTLLERAQSSPHWPTGELRAAAYCLRQAGRRRPQILEELILGASRALDGICHRHGVTDRDLFESLSGNTRTEMEAARDMAVERAGELRTQSGDHAQARALAQLQSKLANVGQKRADSFGSRVREVALQLGFPDPDIVDGYLNQTSVLSSHDWDDLLSTYRGTTAHGRYFDVGGLDPALRPLSRVGRHLMDLGIRMLLATLGYRGALVKIRGKAPERFTGVSRPPRKTGDLRISEADYLPAVSPVGRVPRNASKPIEWVQTTTAPAELGFG